MNKKTSENVKAELRGLMKESIKSKEETVGHINIFLDSLPLDNDVHKTIHQELSKRVKTLRKEVSEVIMHMLNLENRWDRENDNNHI